MCTGEEERCHLQPGGRALLREQAAAGHRQRDHRYRRHGERCFLRGCRSPRPHETAALPHIPSVLCWLPDATAMCASPWSSVSTCLTEEHTMSSSFRVTAGFSYGLESAPISGVHIISSLTVSNRALTIPGSFSTAYTPFMSPYMKVLCTAVSLHRIWVAGARTS